MNRIVLQLLAVAVCFAAGQALTCYDCNLGFFTACLTTKKVCAAGEHCYSGTGKAAGVIDVMKKGCLEVAKCNKTEEVNFPSSSNTSVYTMTKTCCNSDLCNSAPGLPGASGLGLALATLSALLVANVIV